MMYLTTQDASAYVGVSHHTLACWRRGGDGPPYLRLGRVVRYVRADLDAWIAAHRVEPGVGGRRTAPTPVTPQTPHPVRAADPIDDDGDGT
jgi:predicted DNA-binding transcriptional regulator AlpA